MVELISGLKLLVYINALALVCPVSLLPFSILQRAKTKLLAKVVAQGAGVRKTAKLGNLFNAQPAVG
jgi:hypothetical protein